MTGVACQRSCLVKLDVTNRGAMQSRIAWRLNQLRGNATSNDGTNHNKPIAEV